MTRREWLGFLAHLALIAVLVGGAGAYLFGVIL